MSIDSEPKVFLDNFLTQRHWLIAALLASWGNNGAFFLPVYQYAVEVCKYMKDPSNFRGEKDPLLLAPRIKVIEKWLEEENPPTKKTVLL